MMPPATRKPLWTARVSTELAPIPGRVVHDEPFQSAIRLTNVLPENVNAPPAINVPPYTASARTSPLNPAPNACHATPFHRATLFTEIPATTNDPPATRSPLYTANALTKPSPLPNACHAPPVSTPLGTLPTALLTVTVAPLVT